MTQSSQIQTELNFRPVDLRLVSHGLDLSQVALPTAETRYVQPVELTGLIEQLLPSLYLSPEELPYHGLPHPVQVRAETLKLADRVIAQGQVVDRVALEHAAVLHDLWYHLDPKQYGFGSKEELALCVAYTIELMLGAPEEHALNVAQIIAATHHNGPLVTIEQQIIRAADLAGFTNAYPEFKANSDALIKEQGLLTGARPEAVAQMLLGVVLPQYFWPQIALTSAAWNSQGNSNWHQRGMTNIISWFREINPDGQIILDLAGQDPTPQSDRAESGSASLVIVLADNPSDRRSGVARSRARQTERQTKDLIYYLPGDLENVPLPDKSCDLIKLSGTAPPELSEVVRILSDSGVVTFRLVRPFEQLGGHVPQDVSARFRGLGFKLTGISSRREEGNEVTYFGFKRKK